jgi:transcriptional regulator with XRE-family HTH domain
MQSVKHFLVDSGWSHANLADALGIHYSYVSLLLSGKRIASLPLLRKMADETRIPLQTLVEESGKPPPKPRKHNGKGRR